MLSLEPDAGQRRLLLRRSGTALLSHSRPGPSCCHSSTVYIFCPTRFGIGRASNPSWYPGPLRRGKWWIAALTPTPCLVARRQPALWRFLQPQCFPPRHRRARTHPVAPQPRPHRDCPDWCDRPCNASAAAALTVSTALPPLPRYWSQPWHPRHSSGHSIHGGRQRHHRVTRRTARHRRLTIRRTTRLGAGDHPVQTLCKSGNWLWGRCSYTLPDEPTQVQRTCTKCCAGPASLLPTLTMQMKW